jgi:H+/Na+-translocating ferredoxin:NAD+ oxidoreductase subunit B
LPRRRALQYLQHPIEVAKLGGDIMTTSDDYDALAGKLGFPGSALLRSILEALMTPDEARLVEALPASIAEVAQKTGVPEDSARKTLDKLFFKGAIFPKGSFEDRDAYRFARNIIQLHDATLASSALDLEKDRPFFQKWHDFCNQEMYPRLGAIFKSASARISRVVPARRAIEGLEGILPCEDYHEILKAQDVIAVVPCSCRIRTTAVGEQCAHTAEMETWHCLQFGRGAEYVINRGSGRRLSADQAIALCDEIEEDGLIHRWANNANMTGVNTSCNCCRDCCEEYVSLDAADIPVANWWEKSRYEAYVDDLESCSGCQDCVERCQFEAISMYRDENDALKAAIDDEKCFGCGACVVGCPFGSLKMRAARPAESIPGVVV